ncbi:hypothetical protein [Nonomuraea dietziae]|uniref:hypothetical protein n=1 Tax=Nonomuraea dietziae TaxID=65515 RepID=UPI0031D6F937
MRALPKRKYSSTIASGQLAVDVSGRRITEMVPLADPLILVDSGSLTQFSILRRAPTGRRAHPTRWRARSSTQRGDRHAGVLVVVATLLCRGWRARRSLAGLIFFGDLPALWQIYSP